MRSIFVTVSYRVSFMLIGCKLWMMRRGISICLLHACISLVQSMVCVCACECTHPTHAHTTRKHAHVHDHTYHLNGNICNNICCLFLIFLIFLFLFLLLLFLFLFFLIFNYIYNCNRRFTLSWQTVESGRRHRTRSKRYCFNLFFSYYVFEKDSVII